MRVAPGMAWVTASTREALRLGAEQVGTAHLLLGLFAVGGEAARLLGGTGITLESARAVIAGDAEPCAIGDEAFWRPTPAARTVVDASARERHTLDILRGLLADTDAREVIATAGADPSSLLRDDVPGDVYIPQEVSADRSLLPGQAFAHSSSIFVSAPPEAVRSALADAASLRAFAWQDGAVVSDDGLSATRTTRSGNATLRAELIVGDDDLTWVFTALDGKRTGQHAKYERFTLSAAPGGCDVAREQGYRLHGWLGRWAHRMRGTAGGWDLAFGGHQLAAFISSGR